MIKPSDKTATKSRRLTFKTVKLDKVKRKDGLGGVRHGSMLMQMSHPTRSITMDISYLNEDFLWDLHNGAGLEVEIVFRRVETEKQTKLI